MGYRRPTLPRFAVPDVLEVGFHRSKAARSRYVMKCTAILVSLFACTAAYAQDTSQENPRDKLPADKSDGRSTVAPTAGQGRPPIIISATEKEITIRIPLSLDAEPANGDLELGLLTCDQHPDHRIVPTVTQVAATEDKAAKIWQVTLKISGLIPFGDSSAPLLNKGRQIETLRFHRSGLIVRAPIDAPIVAREADRTMLVVLENPGPFSYSGVRARFRFEDADACDVTIDGARRSSQNASSATVADHNCDVFERWTSFPVKELSQVSLRASTDADWFRDAQTGLARSAVRKGLLTLRYGSSSPVFEQNIPIEVRFEPDNWSLTKSMAKVASWLIVGALLSLVLRVSIPNYRRKKALKDQLNECQRATTEISDQVDSQLRVLLRVEMLALDQRRREGWVLGPDFAEVATRVEGGLASLKRKIVLVQRLDAARCRREALLSGAVSPTRIDNIDTNLEAACEGLKSDQLSDADWLFILQKLEAGDKALNEPSQEEKLAFEALLSQRWKAIRDHFGVTPNDKDPEIEELKIPELLQKMADCFPEGLLLPRKKDVDGTAWINSIGAVRADLQLTALELVKQVQFLLPALNGDCKWSKALVHLTEWLATPAISNLVAARRQLLELAEGISPADIVTALAKRQADIDLDPQVVNANQAIRMTVRFRDERLNGATARGAVRCEWRFLPPRTRALRKLKRRDVLAQEPNQRVDDPNKGEGTASAATDVQHETLSGFRINRYFEPDIVEQVVEARFYCKGSPVLADNTPGVPPGPVSLDGSVLYRWKISPGQGSRTQPDRWEKWIWRHAPQLLGLCAALLVPLATLAITTTTGDVSSSHWWDLVGLGFGSETIRNILTGQQTTA